MRLMRRVCAAAAGFAGGVGGRRGGKKEKVVGWLVGWLLGRGEKAEKFYPFHSVIRGWRVENHPRCCAVHSLTALTGGVAGQEGGRGWNSGGGN